MLRPLTNYLFTWAILSGPLVSTGCHNRNQDQDETVQITRQMILDRKIAVLKRYSRQPVREQYDGLASDMADLGLVNLQEMDPNIHVQLAYAGQDNFLDTAIYGQLNTAWLRIEAAAMLSMAQDELTRQKPGYHLLVLDAARPLKVQQAMWDIVQGTPQAGYVANPKIGSLHNYGAAVDLTIVDSLNNKLDMGTPFDFFGDLAQPRYETKFLKSGKLTHEQVANRKLLRDIMKYSGFQTIPNEWWHFNAFTIKHVRENYRIIE
jgi:zinc D-Ala-D-Ala dipeptidase